MRDIRLELNKFKLNDILLEISRLSSEIMLYSNSDDCLIYNTKKFRYRYEIFKGKYSVAEFTLSNWKLIDMAYYSIINVSDVFTKKAFDRNEFMQLIHLYINHPDTNKLPKGNEELLLFLYGFIGEQNAFQYVHKIRENYCREIFIINKMYEQIELDRIVYEEVGVDSKKLTVIMLYLYLISMDSKDILNHPIQLHGIEKNDIKTVVGYYSQTIEFIKNSKLKRQQLYSTPFIKSEVGNTFPINVFLIYYVFQNSIFWCIRNFYKKANSQKFTNDFGHSFEAYVHELMGEYLDSSSFLAIAKADTKRADFLMTLGNYNFLIEVKSSLAGILSKQQDSDIKTTKKFVDLTLLEAVTQLKDTEKFYSDKNFFKIILLYDSYFKSELLEHALRSSISDDGSYWLVTIGELEKLLFVYKENKELFEEIINTKIECEVQHSLDGRDLEQIFERFDIYDNKHIQQEKFTKHFAEIENYITTNQYSVFGLNN